MGVGAIVGAVAGAAVGASTGVAIGTAVSVGFSVGRSYDNYQKQKEMQEKFDSAGSDSPTYSFGPISNTKSQQLPIPILYGRNRVAGNIIYQKITGKDNQNMALQVGVGNGPIESIDDIKADEVDIDADVKLGKRDQSPHNLNENNESFPYIAYITADLNANEDVSGNPTITSIVKGRKVDIWTGSSWKNEYSNNPAWCLLDFLTNSRYGLGINKDNIDIESFKAAADYCDEKVNGEPRFQFDYVIDKKQSSLDIITDILGTFRAFLLYSQGELRLKIDKPSSPVQSFDMDNIVVDSFTYEKTSIKERPNKVLVQYVDPNEHWEKIYAQYTDDGDIRRSGEVREESIALLGINRFDQAGRMARFYLNKAKFCHTFCEFRVGIDSLHCEVGDVITVSHDVPGWIDKEFRILEIAEYENDEMVLRCQEYNEAVYSDDGVPVQVGKDSTLPNPFEPPEEVRNLEISEYGYLNRDGTHIANINVNFDEPNDNRYESAKLSISKDGGQWQSVATIDSNEYQIGNVQTGISYRVKVQSVGGILGSPKTSEGVISKSLTITGKDNKPSDISELIIAQDNENVIFKIEKKDEPDVIGAEIREGADWDSGRIVGTEITGEYYKSDKETDGTKRYMAKAVDRGGNYSKNPTVAIFTVEDSGNNLNVIQKRNELTEGAGNYDALTAYDGEMVFAHNLSFSDYPDLSFATAENNLTFNTMPEIKKIGEYVSDVIDTQKIGRTDIRLTRSTTATDPGGSMSSLPDKSFADYSQYSFAEPPAIYDFEVYVQFSDDNTEWSEWQKFVPGQYKFRYCKFKLILEIESKSAQIEITKFLEIFDVPDVVIEIEDLSISSSGETIVFSNYGKEFYEKPKLFIADIDNSNGMKFPDFKNKSADSVDIDLYDINNNQVSGTAEEIRIQGY